MNVESVLLLICGDEEAELPADVGEEDGCDAVAVVAMDGSRAWSTLSDSASLDLVTLTRFV